VAPTASHKVDRNNQKRIEGGEREHKDVMYFVLKNQKARQSLSNIEPLLNIGLVVSAGSKTTA
jgi:hypothetical protein